MAGRPRRRFQSRTGWGQAEGGSGEARRKCTAAGVAEEESTADAAAVAEKENVAEATSVAEEHGGGNEGEDSRVTMAMGFAVRPV